MKVYLVKKAIQTGDPLAEKKDTGIAKIVFGILGAGTLFFSVFSQILDFLQDTRLTWLLYILGGTSLGVLVFFLKAKFDKNNQEEQKRVRSIVEEENFWGKEFSQWLIINKIDIFDLRINQILAKTKEWGEERIKKLLEENIQIGMTEEMVKLSKGEPMEIIYPDGSLIIENSQWVYQLAKKKMLYIHFEDQIVTRVAE